MRHRRAGSQAAAVVLSNCRVLQRSWWGWTTWDWARLCCSSSAEFRTAQELPTDTTVRPYLIALCHLLGGFTDFQHLGNFNRLYLAQLVFGTEAVRRQWTRSRWSRIAGDIAVRTVRTAATGCPVSWPRPC
ncbi:hypothetical protein [Streptomyces sp. NPDC005181]|uniref:hypothetical protein n=1 Tax=Streptomyces sp. NPDC005181 TaxID=3156869 RepID=UPI0033A32684